METLVAHLQVRAVRTAFLITQDEACAQDVVQDVFIRIYQRIHQYDEKQPFEPYFYRCVVHAAVNAIRSDSKKIALDGDTSEIESLLDGGKSPEAIVEESQQGEQILAALSNLPPRQRAAIVQRYYLEMSEKDMSDTLKTSAGTVKWLLHAARARLREILSPVRSNP